MTDTPLDYATAGVDTAAGDRAVELIAAHIEQRNNADQIDGLDEA